MTYHSLLEPVYKIKEESEVYSLCFPKKIHKNDFLLIGTANGMISFWDLKTFKKENCHSIGSGPIMQMMCHEDKIITQDKLGNLTIWSVNNFTLQFERAVNVKYTGFCKFDVNSSNDILATASENSTVKIFSLPQLSEYVVIERTCMEKQFGMAMTLKMFSVNTNLYILVAYENEELVLFELLNRKEICSTKLQFCATTVEFDENTMQGACAGVTDKIVVFNIVKTDNIEMKINILGSIKIMNEGLSCLKLCPYNSHMMSSGLDGHIRVFKWKSMRPVVVLPEHYDTVNVIAFSHVSKLMAVGSCDKRVSVWCLAE
ncbi:hypothetical protein C0J52_11832 [Blattella germanica]|nr:hypothetical protein C0J52_11832 [Blattella germanica]